MRWVWTMDKILTSLRQLEAEKAALATQLENLRDIVENLRDAILRVHSMAGGRFIQSDTVMRQRIEVLLDQVIDADPVMAGFLGRIPGNDILAGGNLRGE